MKLITQLPNYELVKCLVSYVATLIKGTQYDGHFEILERIARSDIELMSKLREAAIQKRIEDSDQ